MIRPQGKLVIESPTYEMRIFEQTQDVGGSMWERIRWDDTLFEVREELNEIMWHIHSGIEDDSISPTIQL